MPTYPPPHEQIWTKNNSRKFNVAARLDGMLTQIRKPLLSQISIGDKRTGRYTAGPLNSLCRLSDEGAGRNANGEYENSGL